MSLGVIMWLICNDRDELSIAAILNLQSRISSAWRSVL